MSDGLGVFVSLESFAVRALLGSVLAAVVAALAARFGLIRSGRARRTLILAPVVVAAAAAAACLAPGSTFLPSLVVSVADGQPFEVFGSTFAIRRLEWLLVAYGVVAALLLSRRALSHWAIHRYVAAAQPSADHELRAIVRRLATKLQIEAPPLLLVRRCPGGAFTTGVRRPTIAIDPELLETLDPGEVEGLLAHELAHIARRDVTVNAVVGIIRDLTFFVPPMYLATRWLRHEQEHSADDLASDSTGRPAALASSILKVWEGADRAGTRVTAMACATMVPSHSLPVPGGLPTRLLRQGSLSGGARQIAERVVRLIERAAPITLRRQRLEFTVAMVMVMLATAVTVVLPGQVEGELLLGQWRRPLAQPVESPALTTFRTMASSGAVATAVTTATDDHSDALAATETRCTGCLPVESGHEWRTGISPMLPLRSGGWQAGGWPWEAPDTVAPTPPSARPLWGVDSDRGRVGIYLVDSSQG
ncbi:M56 family metallopeptidase [Euzebya tangerina]|uniref:M56 family metallopeptidase n=3 Tax=Euzebya tangerina TaxID=591198 RepID=UPI002F2F967C